MTDSSASEISTSAAARPAPRPTFSLWMTLLMAFFVFGGFGMTYWYPMARGTLSPAPPVVHLHGLVYTAWMILLVAQAWLVNVRSVALHRSLGTFGIALATAVVMMGLLITLLGAQHSREHPGPSYYDGIYLGFMAVSGFGLLFTLAIRNTRSPDVHRRLILLAMLPLLPPGIHRLYMVPLGLTSFPILAMYLTLDAMALAIVIHEWRRTARVSHYTVIGVVWILVQQLLHYPATHSQWFADFVYAVAGMVHYR